MFRTLLTHPLARGHDLDDPQTTILRLKIIQEKPLLKRVYEEWYRSIDDAFDTSSQHILEIGSGAGFLQQNIPLLLTSDLLPLPWITVVLNGQELPFKDASLDALVMVNVLHHIRDPEAFFLEAARCIKLGGKIVMVEPWVTTWSTFAYTHLHHEPFDPSAETWTLSTMGPLSGANGALLWILFERDRERFLKAFPMWQIADIRLSTPLTYLLSGGVSMRSLMPGWTYSFLSRVEALLRPLAHHVAMFARVVLVRD